jgi:hypothetical protein
MHQLHAVASEICLARHMQLVEVDIVACYRRDVFWDPLACAMCDCRQRQLLFFGIIAGLWPFQHAVTFHLSLRLHLNDTLKTR